MKKIDNSIRAAFAVAALTVPGLLSAQSMPVNPVVSFGQSVAVQDVPAATAAGNDESNVQAQLSLEPVTVVPALNGAGLIVMDPTNKPVLSFGYQADLGADSASTGGFSGLVTAAPYVALQSRFGHTQLIVQYNPLFAKYTGENSGSANLQRSSARLIGSFNPRWNWNAGGTFAYGQDSIRLLAPTESVTVGEVAGVGPDAAVYNPNAGVGTFLNAGVGVTYLKSERDSMNLQLGNSYSRFSGIAGDTSTQSARMSFSHKVTPKFSVSPYSQLLTSTGSVACVSVGGGAGVDWQVAQRTGLSLAAGPQFSTRECGTQQSYLFNAALNTQLNEASHLYVVAGRQFGSPYLGSGLWQNSVGAGYQRMFRRSTAASLDLSYAGSAGTGAGADYRGVFVGGSIGRTLGRFLTSSVSYRRIMSRSGSSRLDRDTVVFSISWNSNSIPILGRNWMKR